MVHPKKARATAPAAYNVITCTSRFSSNPISNTDAGQNILVSLLTTFSPSGMWPASVGMTLSCGRKEICHNHRLKTVLRSHWSGKCTVDCLAQGAGEVVTPLYKHKYQNDFSGLLFTNWVRIEHLFLWLFFSFIFNKKPLFKYLQFSLQSSFVQQDFGSTAAWWFG